MSLASISEKVRVRFWSKAAGRYQYEGCNDPLWPDSVNQVEFNVSYIAHTERAAEVDYLLPAHARPRLPRRTLNHGS